MDKLLALLFREIPVYKVYLAWLALLLLLVIVSSIFHPSPDRKASAKNLKTRSDEKFFAFMLKNQLADINLLASNEFVLSSIPIQYNFGFGTNHSGAMVDAWQTPYRIELIGQTNFVVHSAGKDKIFDDADDIIFNSLSNDFVKP
jgi:hypothetical protein